jgi:hypothetical protein
MKALGRYPRLAKILHWLVGSPSQKGLNGQMAWKASALNYRHVPAQQERLVWRHAIPHWQLNQAGV